MFVCDYISLLVFRRAKLSTAQPSFMVRGSGDEPRTSGKPEYDGTLKDWPSAKIMIKSYLHQKQKWLVTKNGVAKKQPVAEKQPSQTAAKKHSCSRHQHRCRRRQPTAPDRGRY